METIIKHLSKRQKHIETSLLLHSNNKHWVVQNHCNSVLGIFTSKKEAIAEAEQFEKTHDDLLQVESFIVNLSINR